jgi:hypothetical protein
MKDECGPICALGNQKRRKINIVPLERTFAIKILPDHEIKYQKVEKTPL